MQTIMRWMVLLGFVPVLAAQSPDQAETIRLLHQQVAAQEDRLETVKEKLRVTDQHIERRIDRLIKSLTAVTDGKDSRTKVLQAKQTAYTALKKNIEFYGRERGQRFMALYQASNQWTKEGLAADVAWLNERIETRVGQALALVASLPAEKDMQKYQTYYIDGDWNHRVDSAYSHQQRVLAGGSQWRDAVFKDLKTSIDRLKRSHVELERALAAAKTSEGRKFVQDLLNLNEALVVKRQEQIQTALGKANPASRALGNKSADALLEQIQAERTANQKDLGEWIRLKNERDQERQRLEFYRVRLAAAQLAQ
ncbi:MAG: hypothetical protein PCFJNLEI_02560 [Verrucomicrobiae bacterium]|nr:hypothetical protein [Verrucomicrobiae bacterium]